MYYNNTSASHSKSICNLFGDFFKTVYNTNQGLNNPINVQANINHYELLNDLCVSEEETFTELNSININKGCGCDLLTPYFLKNVAQSIYVPLTLLFNKSLFEGRFPDRWKIAKILPVYKNGDNTNVSNYRPISILNCCSKIFEKIVHRKLFTHTKTMISKSQHGFYKGRSTLTNLIGFTEYVTKSLDSGFEVDVIYTEFSKAFDKVSHSLLLDKLNRYGISGTNLLWFETYLTQRVQYVEINGVRSHEITHTSGVPQGSTLGPLLFVLFINDVTNILVNSSLLFADDLKIFSSIKSSLDCQSLQNDLNRLYNWCSISF